jgi:hypothetical protein
MAAATDNAQPQNTGLRRSLRFSDLNLYGIILIKPSALSDLIVGRVK